MPDFLTQRLIQCVSKVRDCHGHNLILVEVRCQVHRKLPLVLDYLKEREKNNINNGQIIK